MTARRVAALGGLLWAAGLGCGRDLAPAGGPTYIYGWGNVANPDNGDILAADPGSGRATTLITSRRVARTPLARSCSTARRPTTRI
jgi:hypothetical protein